MATFYWHDYETWGATPSIDRPSQFAGVRTDENLNIIGDPLVIYCQPPEDVLPHPEACLVTGITPQHARANGVRESEFIARIHEELSQPGTCSVGYNSLRFDDEVTRYTLYRNFFDPYEREWRNGNSRWDIIDMVRLVYALRPDGIEWPVVDGKPSFKLELLTQANGIAHSAAHDAFSDVEATIDMARLIKQKKPQLYDYVLKNKSKQAVAKHIDVAARKPLLHISSMFSSEHGCAGLVVPLAAHPTNKNAVIAYDLSVDPSPLESLSVEQIHERVFTSRDNLKEGVERLPIKLIHLNKCPILAPTKMLDAKTASRLHIDREKCESHWRALLNMEVEYKVRELYKLQQFEPRRDPEQSLYDGFIQNDDKSLMTHIRKAGVGELSSTNYLFEDARLNQMVLRYKARNFPESLSDVERAEWQEFKVSRIRDGDEGVLSVFELDQRILELKDEKRDDATALSILTELEAFSAELKRDVHIN